MSLGSCQRVCLNAFHWVHFKWRQRDIYTVYCMSSHVPEFQTVRGISNCERDCTLLMQYTTYVLFYNVHFKHCPLEYIVINHINLCLQHTHTPTCTLTQKKHALLRSSSERVCYVTGMSQRGQSFSANYVTAMSPVQIIHSSLPYIDPFK